MNRKQSSQWAMAKYCLLLPLLAALLVITNCAQAKNSDPAGGQTALAVNDSIYYECEVMPEFEGGMGALFEYLATNIRYPEQAKADEVLTSAVQFVVEKDGKVSNVSLKKSSGNSLLDAEAMRAVESMPKWTPGKQGGSPVRVSFVLPVQFSPGN
jgi:protein TonB